jgi:hypothetical protein
MKQRRAIFYLLLFSVLFITTLIYPKENTSSKFSINLKGGLSYIAGGDVNKHLKTYDDYLIDMTQYEGGETGRLHFGPELEAELRFNLSSKLALSVDIGYISKKNRSVLEFEGPFPFYIPFNNRHYFVMSPKIEAMPIKSGIYYTISSRSKTNFFINIGIGYYFSKVYLYKQHVTPSYGPEAIVYTKEEKYELTANGLGLHSGIGLEYKLVNNLSLLLEIQGRYFMKNLSGTHISSFWEEPWIEEEGNLYIGERDLWDEGYGEHCPDLIISQSTPTGSEFQNIKRAALDLSGILLKVSIRIKLF